MDALTKAPDNTVIQAELGLEDRDLFIRIAHQAGPHCDEAGLALSLVRRFASLHDGAVEAQQDDAGRRQLICRLPECAPFAPSSTETELLLAEGNVSR